MATPKNKRGFRPVVVDGTTYRWRFDEPNRTSDLEIYREAEMGARGQRLCVNIECNVRGPVTGRIVSQIIRCALAEGWSPATPGGDCPLDLVEVSDDESKIRMAPRLPKTPGTAPPDAPQLG